MDKVLDPALSAGSYVTLSQVLDTSGPQFPYLYRGRLVFLVPEVDFCDFKAFEDPGN